MTDMTERIKEHLAQLLQGAPKTRGVEEMRQELLAGCLDKYADLTAQGMEPEEAYAHVVDGIGDVDELLGHIERVNAFDPVAAEQTRRKRALFTCVGVGLILVGITLAIIIGSYFGDGELGGILLFIGSAAGAVVFIYGIMTNPVKYEKTEDTIVEDIKVQMTRGKKKNRLAGLASGSLWCLIVLIYFALDFFWMGHWDVTWLIFPIGAALQCAMSAYFFPKKRRGALTGAYWCAVVVLYFALSFLTDGWEVSWMIYILAAAVMLTARFFAAWRAEK